MITIPQDMALRRLQQKGLLMNFMTEEQKLAVHAKYVADMKAGTAEKAITTAITKLQGDLQVLTAIKAEPVVVVEK
jgi:endonuclease IV